MAEYHVKTSKDGIIKAGTLDKNGAWNHSSNVTEEVLDAVRDHLIVMSMKEGKPIAFTWQYDNGKVHVLKLEEHDAEEKEPEIKDGEPDAGAPQD